MTEKQAKQIFEKYNPESAVSRCPNGRAPVRKMLDIYARAAVNLYGIIPIKDFVELFNSQNIEQTNADEVFTLLLPDVLKKSKNSEGGYYCFYKDCIVNYWAYDDFNFGDFWLREQGDKPRYIPEKAEFLKYENDYYEDKVQNSHWEEVIKFLLQEFQSINIYKFYNDLKEISQLFGSLEFGELLLRYDLSFSSEKRILPFLELISAAHNNIRMFINKGHSPAEIFKIVETHYKDDGKGTRHYT